MLFNKKDCLLINNPFSRQNCLLKNYDEFLFCQSLGYDDYIRGKFRNTENKCFSDMKLTAAYCQFFDDPPEKCQTNKKKETKKKGRKNV